MKDNRIDKLFQEKLSSLEKAPPPMAWDKINDQLHNRKAPLLWWHKAAIVAILCLSGTLIFTLTNRPANKQNAESVIMKNEGQVQPNKQEGNNPSQANMATLDYNDISTEAHAIGEENVESITPIKYRNRVAQAEKNPITRLHSDEQKTLANQGQDIEPIELTHNFDSKPKVEIEEMELIAEAKKVLPVTIEFKAGEKIPEESTLAHTPKSASPLRKLTEKLKEIKYTEIDLAQLRQAKDDLLAFDSNRNSNKTSEEQ